MTDQENAEALAEYKEECLEVVLSYDDLIEKVIEDVDLYRYVSFSDALEIVEQTDDWWTHVDTDIIDISSLAGLLTFENSNTLAYSISNGPDPKIARALYEELKYWADKGII